MNGMDNTTHQLHYPVDDTTTQQHYQVPGVPGAPEPPPTAVISPAAPREAVSGRVAVPDAHAEPPTPPEALATATPPAVAEPTQPAPEGAARGRTTIADEVVEQVIERIVDLTVDSVDGVHGLRSDVDRYFGEHAPEEAQDTGEGAHAAPDRTVAVRLDGARATISFSVEIIFGYAVHEVVDQIRASVIESVERLLGLTVAEVNVAVSEVTFDGATDVELAIATSTGADAVRRTRS